MKYLKKFNTHDEYIDYKESQEFVMPNISYCLDDKHIDTRVILEYVIPTGNSINIDLNNDVSNISGIWIDNIKQDNITSKILLTPGTHVVLLRMVSTTYNAPMQDSYVKQITLPEGIITFRSPAYCTELSKIFISKSVEYILGDFHYCSKLQKIEVDSNNPIFDSRDNCGALIITETNVLYKGSSYTSIIPNSVVEINSNSYGHNILISEINIPDSVISIGEQAFDQSNLRRISIGSGVTTIGHDAFFGCTNLEEIIICNNTILSTNYTINSNLRNIFGNTASIYSFYLTQSLGNYICYGCTNITSVLLDNYLVSIGNYSFQNCTSLTSIVIPNGVISLGNGAFYGCTNLNSVTLSKNLTGIGQEAFLNCNNLVQIEIPSSITQIGTGAFYGCTNLTYIKCLSIIPPTLGFGSFDNTNDCPICVPSESVEAYEFAWSSYASRIQAIS